MNIITSVIHIHCALCLFLAVCRSPSSTLTHVSLRVHTNSQAASLRCLVWDFSWLVFYVIRGADDRKEGEEEEAEEVRQLSSCT